jgi:fumarate reductase flavoprotein subunit
MISGIVFLVLVITGCPMEPVSDEADREVDVVVVGSGIAGSMAALSAKEAGAARVLLIEKRTLFGGTARWSLGGFAAAVVNAKNNPEGSLNDWKAWMEGGAEDTGYPDYDKFLSVAEKAAEAVDYLKSLGLTIIGQVAGGGSVLMTTLEEMMASHGIEVLLNCEAKEISRDNGAVTGIIATYKRKPFRIKAKNVVLATGGFSRNPELVAQWAGTNPGLRYVVSMADSGSTGDGILMAREAGAALYSTTFTKIAGLQFSPALRGIPAFAQSSILAAAPAPLDTQILVNREAKRIMNEAVGGSFGNVSSSNSNGAYTIIKDGKWPYFIIYDANNSVIGGTDISTALEAGVALQNGEVVTGRTPNDLAAAMDVSADMLNETITRYNGFVGAEDEDFGKGSQYLKKIETGPFYAVKVYPNSYGSMGGVVTDSSGRVLDPAGAVIPRLYAVGEVSNRDFYSESYVGGASLALYSTIGRIAGKATAK